MLRKQIKRETVQTTNLSKIGDSITGKVVAIRHGIETKFKTASFLDIETADGNKTSMVITAGLKGVGWENYIGKTVEIVYTGYITPEDGQTGRPYKGYEMYEIDSVAEEAPTQESKGESKGKKK
jgi:hypothetical protein